MKRQILDLSLPNEKTILILTLIKWKDHFCMYSLEMTEHFHVHIYQMKYHLYICVHQMKRPFRIYVCLMKRWFLDLRSSDAETIYMSTFIWQKAIHFYVNPTKRPFPIYICQIKERISTSTSAEWKDLFCSTRAATTSHCMSLHLSLALPKAWRHRPGPWSVKSNMTILHRSDCSTLSMQVSAPVTCAAWSSDGTSLVLGLEDGTVLIRAQDGR